MRGIFVILYKKSIRTPLNPNSLYFRIRPFFFSFISSSLKCRSTLMEKTCKCGEVGVIRRSTTKKNPGRLFYCCTGKGAKCGFIDWVDEDNFNGEKTEKSISPDLQKSLDELQHENRALRLLLVFSWVFLCQF
ncbi:unnamed protein product [Lactuca virosa]|uniref:GRF-type domain-containing protein n=2 Tax=Lactuca virosa TaxID=75947 RepID=A0AAU9LRA7_9ASTR|nr:unnamed protein product [Lactuca virosa]